MCMWVGDWEGGRKGKLEVAKDSGDEGDLCNFEQKSHKW